MQIFVRLLMITLVTASQVIQHYVPRNAQALIYRMSQCQCNNRESYRTKGIVKSAEIENETRNWYIYIYIYSFYRLGFIWYKIENQSALLTKPRFDIYNYFFSSWHLWYLVPQLFKGEVNTCKRPNCAWFFTDSYIETETKCSPISWRHFHIYFPE